MPMTLWSVEKTYSVQDVAGRPGWNVGRVRGRDHAACTVPHARARWRRVLRSSWIHLSLGAAGRGELAARSARRAALCIQSSNSAWVSWTVTLPLIL